MNILVLPIGLGMPGGPELILILLLVLIFFGSKRLPELARSIGKGVSEFKKAMHEATREIEDVTKNVHDAGLAEPPSQTTPEPGPKKTVATSSDKTSSS